MEAVWGFLSGDKGGGGGVVGVVRGGEKGGKGEGGKRPGITCGLFGAGGKPPRKSHQGTPKTRAPNGLGGKKEEKKRKGRGGFHGSLIRGIKLPFAKGEREKKSLEFTTSEKEGKKEKKEGKDNQKTQHNNGTGKEGGGEKRKREPWVLREKKKGKFPGRDKGGGKNKESCPLRSGKKTALSRKRKKLRNQGGKKGGARGILVFRAPLIGGREILSIFIGTIVRKGGKEKKEREKDFRHRRKQSRKGTESAQMSQKRKGLHKGKKRIVYDRFQKKGPCCGKKKK